MLLPHRQDQHLEQWRHWKAIRSPVQVLCGQLTYLYLHTPATAEGQRQAQQALPVIQYNKRTETNANKEFPNILWGQNDNMCNVITALYQQQLEGEIQQQDRSRFLFPPLRPNWPWARQGKT
jgi:hypothetical protein